MLVNLKQEGGRKFSLTNQEWIQNWASFSYHICLGQEGQRERDPTQSLEYKILLLQGKSGSGRLKQREERGKIRETPGWKQGTGQIRWGL